ncbi:MAG: ribose-5-phosphate isomerase, partial [Deltaproteobacteria bacterium]
PTTRSPKHSTLARVHNHANVLCFGERVVGPGVALELVEAFLNGAPQGGRHAQRVAMLTALQAETQGS